MNIVARYYSSYNHTLIGASKISSSCCSNEKDVARASYHILTRVATHHVRKCLLARFVISLQARHKQPLIAKITSRARARLPKTGIFRHRIFCYIVC